MSSVIPLHSPRAGAVPSVASQQAIENALSMALYYMRQPSSPATVQAATARANRALTLLKQVCADTSTASTCGGV